MSVRASLWLLAPLLLAGCATSRTEPYAPVRMPAYTALGADPFWMVAIGDDRIVLRLARDGDACEQVWPRVLPIQEGATTRWHSGAGTRVIGIEARRLPEPCRSGRAAFEDHVRVTLSGRMLEGCGGRIVATR